MELAGQPFDPAQGPPFWGDRGYAMAALLVAMSVMAVLMTALMPAWSHMARREQEEELIFRGKQYARAIGLFQRKFANTPPPSIDLLVEQRFLRKKYKDPITNDDFQPIYANQQAAVGAPGGATVALRPGETATTTLSTPAQQQQRSGNTGAQGGVIGVTSKSKDESIKLYNGRGRYNEWAFVYIQTTQQPGQSVNLPPTPGQKPGAFGMQPGNLRPGQSQPNRPPVNLPNMPGQMPGQFPGRPGQFQGQPFGQPNPVPGQGVQPPFTPGQPRRPGGH
jgi:type II secretory pathway pseudopilin PulG